MQKDIHKSVGIGCDIFWAELFHAVRLYLFQVQKKDNKIIVSSKIVKSINKTKAQMISTSFCF